MTGPGVVKRGVCEVGALLQIERQHDVHRAFDRRAADLAVALHRMRVADREERARHLDRQIEHRAGGKVADVEIAADAPRRHDGMEPRLGRRHADRAGEGFERHARMRAEGGRLPRRAVVGPQMQRRLAELVGEQAEARDVRRPAEAGRHELADRDFQRVARLGAFHVDRAGDRIDPAEIEVRDVGDRARRGELAGRSVDALELERRAGRHPRGGRERVVPPEVMVAAVDRVAVATGHRSRTRSRRRSGCAPGRHRARHRRPCAANAW